MLKQKHFYNRTIRKIVVAFGTLFNDIQVARYDRNGNQKEVIKVPLNYGAKEKYLTRLTSDPNLVKSIATSVPRMSFDLIGIEYDTSRKQMSTLMNFSANDANSVKTQYAPLPYNFNFTMSIYVRHTEDGTQIVEQILPYFTPDYTVTVDLIPSLDQKYDMPIILNSVSPDTTYEGDMMETRLIIWTLEFTVKGYIFPRVKGDDEAGPIIRRTDTNIFTDTNISNNIVAMNITTTPFPSDAEPDDEFGFAEVITNFPNTLP
jgi:hypothetical protein